MAGAFTLIAKIDEREVVAALDRLRQRAERMAPAFKNIGEELQRSTQERFGRQVDPEGRPWQELKASTQAAKAKRGQSSKILRQRGYLADTIRYQVNGGGLRIGTNRIYGAIHQLGGKAGRGRKAEIPARPFLGISAQDRERILEIVTDFLEM
jgi:phage virion morphogenesis protein